MPVIPRQEFKGRSDRATAGSLLVLDADFGTLLDLLDELGAADDTLVVFAGDNPKTSSSGAESPATGKAPTSPAARKPAI
jgi:arylsulfatase A-like enzyme